MNRAELGHDVESYLDSWREWRTHHGLAVLKDARPTAIGLKVPNIGSFVGVTGELTVESTQVHIGIVDGRRIGSFVLKKPIAGVPILKLMQRRPGSSDPWGLDHVDFLHPDPEAVAAALEAEGSPFERQSNAAHEWLSVRFGPGAQEAKIVGHTVLDVCVAELRAVSEQLSQPQAGES